MLENSKKKKKKKKKKSLFSGPDCGGWVRIRAWAFIRIFMEYIQEIPYSI